MIGLLIVFSAGVILGFCAGLSAGLWSCGRDDQTG
jgi:hypothetical protein